MTGADEYTRTMLTRSGTDRLPAHLAATYGIEVASLSELDLGVFQVNRTDGPAWVARVFPAARPAGAAAGDAAVLDFLADAGFSVERRAAPPSPRQHVIRPGACGATRPRRGRRRRRLR
jgi:hypothetical protein